MNFLNLLWRFFGGTTNKSAIGSYCSIAGGTTNYTPVAPLGLYSCGRCHFYTHIPPLGLKRWGHRVAIDIPPRWG